jgi:hypothetical protein
MTKFNPRKIPVSTGEMLEEEEILQQYMIELGRKGGLTTSRRLGKEHMTKISKLGLEKRWGKKDKPEENKEEETH